MQLDTEQLDARQRYRLITSLVVPRPIGWISTRSARGVPNLAPFSYFNALSATPMLVGASVGQRRGGAPKDTLANVRETGAFAVNLVAERQLEAMVRTSGAWPPETSEFDEAGLELAEAGSVDAPVVADAAATLECALYREIPLEPGPNTLIIGEVVAVRLSSELRVDLETLHVDVESYRPVGRLGLDQYTLLGEVRRVPRPSVEP